MKKILYTASAMLLLVSCTDDSKSYETDHPNHGKLTLSSDWSERSSGVDVPASYTVEVAGQKVTLQGEINAYSNLFEPGSYKFNLYNQADKVTVDGSTLTADNTAQIGWQFFGQHVQTIEEDKVYSETVVMKQITRQLDFDLTINEGDPAKISGITATFSGIARAWDCVANAPIGAATTIVPTFTRNGDKLTAMVRILGVTGAEQKLTLTLTFVEAGRIQTIETDLSLQLASFNANKVQMAKLTGDVKTPIMVESIGDINGDINDWQDGSNNEFVTAE